MEKRLYRNEHDKVIAGVGSGLAEFLSLDVSLVRVLLVLFSVVTPGIGLIVYFVLWIAAPVRNNFNQNFTSFNTSYDSNPFNQDPLNKADAQFNKFSQPGSWNVGGNANPNDSWNAQQFNPEEPFEFKTNSSSEQKSRIIIGSILIAVGSFALLKKLSLIPVWVSFYKLWPLAIIALGIMMILNRKRKQEWNEFVKNNPVGTAQPEKTDGDVEPAKTEH